MIETETGVLGAILTIISSWFLTIFKKQSTDIKELDRRLRTVETELPKDYVSKEDFTHFDDRLFTKLDRMESKIEGKADK